MRLLYGCLTSPVRGGIKPEAVKKGIRIPNGAPPQAQNRDGYASFGGGGATATVNAYGNIMQLSRYLGVTCSGFFCVDDPNTWEPFYVELRSSQLADLSKRPNGGIGLQFENASEWHFDKEKPSLEFVHDIWPRFTFERPNFSKLSLQYFCHNRDGIVFQRYNFKRKNKSPSISIPAGLSIDANMLIRNLDYVSDNNKFNDTWDKNNQYHKTEAHGRSLIVQHKIPWDTWEQETNELKKQVTKDEFINMQETHSVGCLIITAFGNGIAQEFKRASHSGDRTKYEIILDQKARNDFENTGKLDITIAYTLRSLPKVTNWKESVVSGSQLADMGARFSVPEYSSSARLQFSPHKHLDFVVRRNLQHILSVCSVKVPNCDPNLERSTSARLDAVALTCGDISSHRVSPAASLCVAYNFSLGWTETDNQSFAFQFLAEVFNYLKLNYKNPQKLSSNAKDCSCKDAGPTSCPDCKRIQKIVRSTCRKIWETCTGHLFWVFFNTQPTNEQFSPHYWVSGKPITGWEEDNWLTSRTLADTPFHIIKVWTFKQAMVDAKNENQSLSEDDLMAKFNQSVMKRTIEPERILEKLKSELPARIKPWIRTLDNADKRGTHAFSRPTKLSDEEKGDRFHLADHVWIYKALKAVEDLGLQSELMLSDREKDRVMPEIDKQSGKDESANIYRWYHFSSGELQKAVWKRFATENPVSKQRMLATSRTSSETRFLFHSKDTALFYWDDFFTQADEGSRKHETRDKKRGEDSWRHKVDTWRNTVDCQVKHEESQSWDWEKPLRYALALMAGYRRRKINSLSTDDLMRKATNLLFSISSPSGIFAGRLDDSKEPVPFETEMEPGDFWRATFEIPYILWKFGRQHLEESIQEESQGISREDPEDRGMAKQQPSSEAVVGTSGQVSSGTRAGQTMRKRMEVPDFKNSIDQRVIVDLKDDWLLPGPESLDFKFEHDKLEPGDNEGTTARILKISNDEIDESRNIITKAMKSYKGSFLDPDGLKGSVVDVPKGPLGKGIKLSDVMPQNNPDMLKTLAKKRTVHEARKRVIWFHNGDAETALICYFASPQAERENLSSFFDRHASYEKYFLDSTTAALNEWETELHLSFFRKGTGKNGQGGIPSPTFVTLQEPLLKDTSTEITRTVMSFRFVGDFFDRYWTCHFLEHNCLPDKNVDLKSHLSTLNHIQPKNGGKDHPWQQRKVLELLLFNKILEEMMVRTKELLEWAQDQVLRPLELRKAQNQQDKAPAPDRFTPPLHKQEEKSPPFAENQEGQVPEPQPVQPTGPPNTAEKSLHTPGNVEPQTSMERQPQTQTLTAPKQSPPKPQPNTLFEQPFKVETYHPEENPLAKLLQRDSQFLLQGNSESYFAINERWRIMEQILQAVEDDLSENIERIHDWMRRDKDRESEKPRWTKNDEKKYRSSITKLQVLNQRKVREIERLQTRIRVFRESLSSRLASIRDDISFRGSENINLFTYVTVVFLPLGFAASVFSMSGAPERNTLISMVITSVAALFITIVALINAKSLDYKAIEPITGPIVKTLRRVGNLLLYFALPVLYLILLIISPFLLIAYVVVYLFHRFVVMPISEPQLDLIINLRDWYIRLVQRYDPVKDAKFRYLEKRGREDTTNSSEKKVTVFTGARDQVDDVDGGNSSRRKKATDIESGEHTPDAQ